MTTIYFLNSTALSTGVHAATDELEANETIGGAGTVAENIAASSEELIMVWTTPSSVPNNADWEDGYYKYSVDISAVGANINVGFSTVGSTVGHFARVDDGLTTDSETNAIGSPFTGVGIHTASGEWNPSVRTSGLACGWKLAFQV